MSLFKNSQSPVSVLKYNGMLIIIITWFWWV